MSATLIAPYRAPKLLIDGRWRAGQHALSHPLIDPSNGQPLSLIHI